MARRSAWWVRGITFADPYQAMIDAGVFKPRIHPVVDAERHTSIADAGGDGAEARRAGSGGLGAPDDARPLGGELPSRSAREWLRFYRDPQSVERQQLHPGRPGQREVEAVGLHGGLGGLPVGGREILRARRRARPAQPAGAVQAGDGSAPALAAEEGLHRGVRHAGRHPGPEDAAGSGGLPVRGARRSAAGWRRKIASSSSCRCSSRARSTCRTAGAGDARQRQAGRHGQGVRRRGVLLLAVLSRTTTCSTAWPGSRIPKAELAFPTQTGRDWLAQQQVSAASAWRSARARSSAGPGATAVIARRSGPARWRCEEAAAPCEVAPL